MGGGDPSDGGDLIGSGDSTRGGDPMSFSDPIGWGRAYGMRRAHGLWRARGEPMGCGSFSVALAAKCGGDQMSTWIFGVVGRLCSRRPAQWSWPPRRTQRRRRSRDASGLGPRLGRAQGVLECAAQGRGGRGLISMLVAHSLHLSLQVVNSLCSFEAQCEAQCLQVTEVRRVSTHTASPSLPRLDDGSRFLGLDVQGSDGRVGCVDI